MNIAQLMNAQNLLHGAELEKLEYLMGFVDYKMKILSVEQRLILSVIVIIIMLLSIIGNIATLTVCIKSRKIRQFFRTCLISLACSDLSFTIFQGIIYLSQYISPLAHVWTLGGFMCGFSPFITTVAVLVNSMTVVGIALDRYLAVMRVVRGAWEPGGIFCAGFVIVIWGTSAGIASPTVRAYTNYPIHVLMTDSKNESIFTGLESGHYCAAIKKENTHYYLTVLCILFIPMVLAFIWLNTVIACEILNRRKTMNKTYNFTSSSEDLSSSSKITTTDPRTSPESNHSTKNPDSSSYKPKTTKYKTRTNRDRRQLRMFCVVFLLMIMFIVCRMPTWIYLIMKFYNTYTSATHWILQYSFGILAMFNCVMNPLLYAFLTQTIQCTIFMSRKAQKYCGLEKLFARGARNARNLVASNASDGQVFVISADSK